MRKALKKIMLLLLCVCMTQGAAFYAVPQEIRAADKEGLKKESGSYYYYENGVKVTNTWKTIKKKSGSKTVSYKYYFGSDGKAYMANDLRKTEGCKNNVVVKKIGKYYYGFDRLGHMVKSGYYNDPEKTDKNGDTYTYYFNKNGRMNSKKSKAIRKAAKYENNASKVRKILGTPKKETEQTCCEGRTGGGTDYLLTYANIIVSVHRYPTGKEIVLGVMPV